MAYFLLKKETKLNDIKQSCLFQPVKEVVDVVKRCSIYSVRKRVSAMVARRERPDLLIHFDELIDANALQDKSSTQNVLPASSMALGLIGNGWMVKWWGRVDYDHLS